MGAAINGVNEMKSIVAFSGGLDSIYVLWKELTETSNEVTAVYFATPAYLYDVRKKYKINALTSPIQSTNLANAMRNLALTIESKTRPFDLAIVPYDSTKIVNLETGSNHASVLRVKWAIDRINAGMADRFVVGHCRDNDGALADNAETQKTDTASSLSMAAFKELAMRGEYALPLQDVNYTIANAYAELPQELIDANLSCDSSATQGPCGVCYKCSMHQYAKDKLASGMTPDQFFEHAMSKSMIAPGMWRSERRWLAEEVPTYQTDITNDWPMPEFPTSYKVSEV
jgi:7-cyano-7-deazaguanine synthase in queuosine biosynthesis